MTKSLTFVALLFALGCGGKSPLAPSEGQTAAPSVVAAPTAQSVLTKWRMGQPIRILVLGNSISATDDPGNGVIAQVRRLVESRSPGSVVVNASVSGATTASMTTEFLRSRPSGYDLAFIPLQINDANQGAPVEGFKIRTQWLIDQLTAAHIVPVLVKENDIFSIPEERYGTPIRDYMTAVDQLAASNQLSIVDGYGPFHQAVMSGGGIASCGLFIDELYVGLHPNQKGHDLLFQAYERWFK
jgi:lysophospholipase L1-like esterase